MLVTALALHAGATRAYESSAVVYLDQVLASSLIRSGHHRVLDEVHTSGNALEFEIESSYGSYRVRSLPMLVGRVHEIRTLAQAVDPFERNNQRLATELRGQLQVGADSFVDIITSPLHTTAQLVDQATHNVGQTLVELNQLSAGGSAVSEAKRSVYEQMIPNDPVLASHKRNIANQLNLDVYSTNPRVQEFLDTVARARAGGQSSAGAIAVSLPPSAEVTIAGGRVAGRIRTALTHKTSGELYQYNAANLGDAGVAEDLRNAFLDHPRLSPRHKTAVTEYLLVLDGVSNRGAVLEAALDATDEPDAAYYVQMARMLASYHEREDRLRELLSSGHIGVGITRSNAVLIVVPFDIVFWDRDTDAIFSELAAYAGEQGYLARQVLVSGVLTPQARDQFAARGFDVRERFLFRR